MPARRELRKSKPKILSLTYKNIFMKNTYLLLISTFIIMLVSCGEAPKDPVAAESAQYDLAIAEKMGELFEPLPNTANSDANPTTTAKVRLGHVLYFDTRLSKTGNNSCNSCHNLATFGVDHFPTSPGDAGKNGDRNSPTVLNAALHFTQFWDGRAKDVEEQAGMPILNPVEMAIPNEQYLINRLSGIDLYKDLFKNAYPESSNPITYTNLRKAIAAFERTLLTPSRFDQYLKGDKNALTVMEKKGLLTFIMTGCTTCHSGKLLGGNMFQKFGVYNDYWNYTNSNTIDKGVAEVTGKELDKYMFKVPSLRNIVETYPYLHDGSVKELSKVVEIMGKVQLDKELSEDQISKIVAFLGSLTGEVPIEASTLPAELK